MSLVKKFKIEQLRLAEKVDPKDSFSKIKTIAAVDISYMDDKAVAAIVVLNYKTMEIIERKFTVVKIDIPYIPTYIGFREAPAIVKAYGKLENKPDILMLDGHGIAHPRKMGLASHVGLMLDIPTLGVAKKLVMGDVKEGKIYFDRDLRGFEVVTKEFAKPVYVSPGHKMAVGTALKIVRETLKGHKLPEPLQKAHIYANKVKKKLIEEEKK